jgi:hypothetical protein
MNRQRPATATAPSSSTAKPRSEPKDVFLAAPDAEKTGQKPKSAPVEMTRVRAFQKWEAAGKPAGDGVQFWIEAEQELLAAEEGRFA